MNLIPGNNNIKHMNGRAFDGLYLLNYFDADGNDCINQDFITESRIQVLSETIDRSCGFESYLSYDDDPDNSLGFSVHTQNKIFLFSLSSVAASIINFRGN